MSKALFVTMEFWPFLGGVARYYKNFCDEWEDVVVYVHEDKRKSHFSEFLISNFQFLNKSQIPNPPSSEAELLRRTGKSQTPSEADPSSAENSKSQNSNDQNIKGTAQLSFGYEVIRRSFFWKFIWPHWGKLFKDLFWYIGREKPNIIFVGQILPVGTVAYLLQQIFHFDYVVFVHGLDILWAARGNRLKRWLTQRILQNSCLVIANSEYTKKMTSELFPIPEQKIMALYPKAFGSTRIKNQESGIKNKAFVISSGALAESRNLTPEGFVSMMRSLGYARDDKIPIVLSGGRLVARKGFDDVIEVAREFQGKAVFVIFGRGPEEERLRTLIHQQRLENTVLLKTRSLSDEELSVLYDSCDVFVFLPKELPGGDVEGFGQVVLEAQSHGKPVIVRNSGGAGEALVPAETGFLWDGMDQGQLHQYINILIYDGEKRRLMGERGREFARMVSEKFDQRVVEMKKALVGQEKKVSVVIPVGYGLDRLGPTLESLARQTYKNIEVIIVGDGIQLDVIPGFGLGSKQPKQTKKNSFGFLFSFLDSRLRGNDNGSNFSFPHKFFSIPKSGAAAARNAGARRATGEYLLFVDDDTVLREDCIEKMIRRLQLRNRERHPEPHIKYGVSFDSARLPNGQGTRNKQQKDLSSQTLIWDPNNKNQKQKELQSFDVSFGFLDSRFRGNDKGKDVNGGRGVSFVYSGFRLGWKTMPAVRFDLKTAYEFPYFDTTSMIRREAFAGFDESLKRLQDWDLFLTLVDKGGTGEAINEYLYRKSARLFKNLLRWRGISFWFPKFIWKLPFIKQLYNLLPPVKQYHEAVRVVKRKHRL